MNWADITAIIGALGGAGGALAFADWLRKRKRIPIDQSAAISNNMLGFIEKLQVQADTLQRQLNSANNRAEDLEAKLRAANARADDLQEKHDTLLIQLSDAQFQMRSMRTTINTLSDALDKRGQGM
jgi:chromosome segregation ATPase